MVHADVVVYNVDLASISNSKFTAYIIPDIKYQPPYDLCSLVNSLKFDRKFASGRFTKLFGDLPYTYGNVSHKTSKLSDNEFVLDMFNFVTAILPRFQVNSCLINYYPDSKSSIPDHSDDEIEIDDNSFIVTLSLGSDRTMHFKCKHDKTLISTVTLSHGMVLIFSKSSQTIFTHGIPPNYCISSIDDYIPRVSATFRKLIS